MKKRIALLLAVCLFIGSPFVAFAAKPGVTGKPSQVVTPLYLNLGDSIAYGMSAAPGQGYFDLFADYLDVGPSMNLGVPGATTADLLDALGTKEYQRAVQRADIITISIGGNNLLGPVIEAMSDLLEITPEELVTIHNNPMALNQAFTTATSKLIPFGFNPVEDDLMTAIVNYVILNAEEGIAGGAFAFRTEWPDIYSAIRELNPNATIIPLSILNPFFYAGNDTLMEAFSFFAVPMNDLLTFYGLTKENTYVIDANPYFYADPNAVAFSLDMATPNLDIHPTTIGHSIIFDLLKPLAEMRAFQPGKPEGVGKASDAMVEELQMNNTEDPLAAHEVTGAEFVELMSEMAQENLGVLADHTNSNATGLPAIHEDEFGDPLSGYEFGQAVSSLAKDDPSALVQHVRER